MKQKNKRLSMDMPINIVQEIKARSARRNISMKLWVYRAIVKAIKEENKYK